MNGTTDAVPQVAAAAFSTGGSPLSFLLFEAFCFMGLVASYFLLRRRKEELLQRQQQRYRRLAANAEIAARDEATFAALPQSSAGGGAAGQLESVGGSPTPPTPLLATSGRVHSRQASRADGTGDIEMRTPTAPR